MSSHVVVLDSTARRAVIKVQPGKYLSDVQQEACSKFKVDPARHGLKSNNKTLDLSQPFRLSGLPSGAKLQLVVLSKSPAVVSIALQLPESEGTSSRLTDKFPSTTTLWLLLRKFESDLGGQRSTRNFTARAVPRIEEGENGSGRLFYETPVIHIMGRELTSMGDLQKSLAQLGINDGSALLRLSFRATPRPLEEAMAEIDQYFKSIEPAVEKAKAIPDESQPIHGKDRENDPSPLESTSPATQDLSPSELPTAPPYEKAEKPSSESTAVPDNLISGPSHRPIKVYAPPLSTAPAAARQAFNERDYEPTVDHAKLHQARLSTYGRNKTLPSDAELAAQAEARAQRKAEVKSVNIKVRFPDQSTVICEFKDLETTISLYEFVTQCLDNEAEPFSLNFSTAKGPQKIIRESNKRLISGLGMTGSMMVNVIWEEGASNAARAGETVLKAVYRKQAVDITVKEPEGVEMEENTQSDQKEKPAKREGEGKKGAVPKWFKLGKKGGA